MHIRTIAVLALAACVAACGSNPPLVDYDASANFAGYRSYAFISDRPMMRAPDSPPGSPLLEGQLISATDRTLQAKGYSKVDDPESADFAVSFTVGARDKIRVNSYPEPYRPYYGTWGCCAPYYGGGSTVNVDQYTEGTLAIDVYDVAEHKPVWHGVATRRITQKMRENPSETVSEIVSEILAGYPPGMSSE